MLNIEDDDLCEDRRLAIEKELSRMPGMIDCCSFACVVGLAVCCFMKLAESFLCLKMRALGLIEHFNETKHVYESLRMSMIAWEMT